MLNRPLHFLFIGAAGMVLSLATAMADGVSDSSTTASSSIITLAAPIPLEEVSTQTEVTSDNMREVAAELAADPVAANLGRELPAFTREVNARLEESAKLVRPSPSLETLRRQETSLVKITQTLDDWNEQLTRRAEQLDKERAHLAQLAQTWALTLHAAQSPDTPPQALENIRTAQAMVQEALAAVQKRRLAILTLQNRIAEEDRRVDRAIDAVKQARSHLVARLLKQDSPPIWKVQASSGTNAGWVPEARDSVATQIRGLAAYAERQEGKFLLHALIVLLLLAALFWARRRIPGWVGEEPQLQNTVRIFDSPIRIALVLSILASGWLYPQAPRLLWAILGAVALVPTALILRRLIEPHLFPILNALVVFYILDQMRIVLAALPLESRCLLAVELFSGIVFLAWLVMAGLSKVLDAGRDDFWRVIRAATQLALAMITVAFIANILGYVSLATLLGDAVLGSADLAVVLYASVRIIEVIVMLALRARPLTLLGAVSKNRTLVWNRVCRLFRWAAVAVWALYTLECLALRGPLFEWGNKALTATWTLGTLSFSLGNIVAFCLMVWAAFQVSRFVRFLLEEDIFPRLQLAAGLPYAISMMLHYVILVAGFLLATSALGFDMTKFTILAGAFGVGLGFGMQTIINNFVSGLILLFERPIKVGDVIQMDDAEGTVHDIGIRATKIHTSSGSEVIVPNGNLIANKVVNWTASTRQRSIEISIAVGAAVDAGHVIDLLQRVAAAHPLVAKKPAPQAFFTKFGGGALNFDLRVWTDHLDQRLQIRSELTSAVNAALAKEKIPVQ